MGRVCVAFINRSMLATSEKTNAAYQIYISSPVVVFAFPRLEVKATSNKPAMIKIIQFMTFDFMSASSWSGGCQELSYDKSSYLSSARILLRDTGVIPR